MGLVGVVAPESLRTGVLGWLWVGTMAHDFGMRCIEQSYRGIPFGTGMVIDFSQCNIITSI